MNAGVTILLAEDDPDIRESLRDLLHENGFEVLLACNGVEGMEHARRLKRAALVVMDLHMPMLSGYDMLDQMRADPELARLPVLVISASPDRVRLGNIPILRKPFDADDFIAAVQRAVDKLAPKGQ